MGSDQVPAHASPPGLLISIHAPAWGATRLDHCTNRQPRHFNPRSRMGSDPSHRRQRSRLHHFNPRSRMGSDQNTSHSLSVIWLFQSTLPHGERPCPSSRWGRSCYFNPRSRMGSDGFGFLSLSGPFEFQSTLPHGERPSANAEYIALEISIHAPAWGATCRVAQQGNPYRISIHAPAWGATS